MPRAHGVAAHTGRSPLPRQRRSSVRRPSLLTYESSGCSGDEVLLVWNSPAPTHITDVQQRRGGDIIVTALPHRIIGAGSLPGGISLDGSAGVEEIPSRALNTAGGGKTLRCGRPWHLSGGRFFRGGIGWDKLIPVHIMPGGSYVCPIVWCHRPACRPGMKIERTAPEITFAGQRERPGNSILLQGRGARAPQVRRAVPGPACGAPCHFETGPERLLEAASRRLSCLSRMMDRAGLGRC